jgi:N-acetylneuraminic acid mutarotase
MAAIEEEGAVWNYDPFENMWYKVGPVDKSQPYPQGRSYHCAASDGQTCFYIHAGCTAEGRLSDLWKFDLFSRSWLQLQDAPAPARGGASIATRSGKLFRMHGFDGNTEQGGRLDIFDIDENSWSTETYPADGKNGPLPRSVCALLPVTIRDQEKLVTLFGERDPSSQGHAGAGNMLEDVWIYDIADKEWTKLETHGKDGVPEARGWFAADVIRPQDGEQSILVQGGLNENNERLGDAWILSF